MDRAFPLLLLIFHFAFFPLKGSEGFLSGLESAEVLPTAGFSSRNTFIYGFNAPVFSFKLGAEMKGKLRMGISYNYLKQPEFKSYKDKFPFVYLKQVSGVNGVDTVPAFLRLRYMAYYGDYTYYNKDKWEFSIPIHLGLGKSFYEYSEGSKKVRERESMVFVYEPATSVQYRIIPWFGVGVDIGYRFIIVDNKFIGNNFNSPIYNLKTLIFWGELYRSIVKKKAP
jgi:hypothetical protein